MLRLAIIFSVLPIVAFAQSAPQTSAQRFAAALASDLTSALVENDLLRAQVADLQKQITAVKAPTPSGSDK